jgi:hypothetical protein
MTVLPNLERLLGDAAEKLAPVNDAAAAEGGVSRTSTPRSRSWRPLALAVVLVLGGVSGALAAAGVFQTGKPIGPQPGYAPVSNVGWGAPRAGSMKVLALRVADPAGGPPWGLGMFTTTRGLACPVTGRVVDGRLGALGIDYAFADDGRFHRLLAPAGIGPDCSPPDARGHVFAFGEGWLESASGDAAPAAAIDQRPDCLLPGYQGRGVRCPQADLRTVFYGFLGPDARTVSYTYEGVRHVEHVSGSSGGYLIVLPAPPGVAVGRAAKYGDVAPPTTVYVTYASGRRCSLQSANPVASRPGPCQAVGYAKRPLDLPTRKALATPTRVSFDSKLPIGLLAPGPALLVKFTARIAAATITSGYAVEAHRPSTQACTKAFSARGGFIPLVDNTTTAIKSGQPVTLVLALKPLCAGRYSGRLYYYRAPTYSGLLPIGLPATRAETAEVTIKHFAINVP